jgi:hypothetical protein
MQLQVMFLAPAAELRHGLHVGRARVLVADRRREKFQECSLVFSPAAAMMAGTGNVPGEAGRSGEGISSPVIRGLWQGVKGESRHRKIFAVAYDA